MKVKQIGLLLLLVASALVFDTVSARGGGFHGEGFHGGRGFYGGYEYAPADVYFDYGPGYGYYDEDYGYGPDYGYYYGPGIVGGAVEGAGQAVAGIGRALGL
jgi:hypothetical protein